MNNVSISDKKKIIEYQKTLYKYPKPSVTADIIAIRPAYSELKATQWRENPEFGLEVLFIKRGQWPHEGKWAIPGGFIRPDESVEEGAKRELIEETSLKSERLIPIGVFSKPGRDMRSWVISNAFVSVHKRGEGQQVHGGDDAKDAKWLLLKSPKIGDGLFNFEFCDGEKPLFTITGKYQKEEVGGDSVISVDKNPLAFDHGEIFAQAFLRLLSFDIKTLVFFFLPEKFTLGSYIDVYQYLTGNSIEGINIPNFRRQLISTKEPLLEVCEGEIEPLDGRAHAPAKLYRRRV